MRIARVLGVLAAVAGWPAWLAGQGPAAAPASCEAGGSGEVRVRPVGARGSGGRARHALADCVGLRRRRRPVRHRHPRRVIDQGLPGGRGRGEAGQGDLRHLPGSAADRAALPDARPLPAAGQPAAATRCTSSTTAAASRWRSSTLDASGQAPALTWIGCAVAPDPIGLNSVLALPGGGFVATNFQPRAPAGAAGGGFQSALINGENNGELWEWHTGRGWAKVPGSESAGANGLELSKDGKWFYVAQWGNRSFMRVSRGQTPVVRDTLKLGFRVDNVRWAPDGTLLVAGQGGPGLRHLRPGARRGPVHRRRHVDDRPRGSEQVDLRHDRGLPDQPGDLRRDGRDSGRRRAVGRVVPRRPHRAISGEGPALSLRPQRLAATPANVRKSVI